MPLATKRQQGSRRVLKTPGTVFIWHRFQGGPDYSPVTASDVVLVEIKTPPSSAQTSSLPLLLLTLDDPLRGSILLHEPIPRATRYEYLEFPKASRLVTIELFGEKEWVASLPEAHVFVEAASAKEAKQALLDKCRRDLRFLRRNRSRLGSHLQQKLAVLLSLF